MKRIGIMGGMGPMATVDLMKKIILATEAGCDQEHIPMLVDNAPQIPDRTKAIEKAVSLAKKGDTILLLGKGHESTIIYKDGPIPWDERTIAEQALKKLR